MQSFSTIYCFFHRTRKHTHSHTHTHTHTHTDSFYLLEEKLWEGGGEGKNENFREDKNVYDLQ